MGMPQSYNIGRSETGSDSAAKEGAAAADGGPSSVCEAGWVRGATKSSMGQPRKRPKGRGASTRGLGVRG